MLRSLSVPGSVVTVELGESVGLARVAQFDLVLDIAVKDGLSWTEKTMTNVMLRSVHFFYAHWIIACGAQKNV